jgi:hypothetical protein
MYQRHRRREHLERLEHLEHPERLRQHQRRERLERLERLGHLEHLEHLGHLHQHQIRSRHGEAAEARKNTTDDKRDVECSVAKEKCDAMGAAAKDS